MLTDLGLQTQEQIDKHNGFMKRRANSMLDGTFQTSCVSTALCNNCNHLFSDSICACAGLGVCPNCKFDNSPKIVYSPKVNGGPFIDTHKWFGYSKNDFIKIVDRVFNTESCSIDDESAAILERQLKEEINKL